MKKQLITTVTYRKQQFQVTNSCLYLSMYDFQTIYLWVCLAINAFRVAMYTFQPEAVAKVKMSKQAWEDLNIREVMYAQTGMIRTFMAFRLIICAWALLISLNSHQKFTLGLAIFATDVYMMLQIIWKANTTYRVLNHRNIYLPGSIQASICTVGAVCLSIAYFQ